MMKQHRASMEAGTALYMSVVALIVLVSISTAMIMVSARTREEYAASKEDMQRRCLAESGVARALLDLHAGGTGDLGTAASPVAYGAGSYYVSAEAQSENLIVLTSRGVVGTDSRAVRAVVTKVLGLFHHAMYIGNSSGDPTYTLRLGGTGSAADLVNGDLYCGGNVSIEGDSSVTGAIRATGSISGAEGTSGITFPPPDLARMDYPSNHDVNVAAEFQASAVYRSISNGGSAYQVPEDKRSHIFRMNPNDRVACTAATAKNDYFLEDPYELFSANAALNFTSATKISLAGTNGKPGLNGNRLVYYVDGNVWLHSRATFSFGFNHAEPDGLQITIVARGNVYFSDNFFYKSLSTDAVAFLAIRDPSVADSGNIYFGDPTFGTLARMEGFMYAENDFYDLNLDDPSTPSIDVYGIMSAGNQVNITRSTPEARAESSRTKLVVTLDDRVKSGEVSVPGMPFLEAGSLSEGSYEVMSVMPVSDGR
ncbi:MAG: hypothetical protein MUE73_01145 [Planctomycetes bacterium]|nr:hypothetical protein [Planctomycetota bacterium]